jgi:hypothetical protein
LDFGGSLLLRADSPVNASKGNSLKSFQQNLFEEGVKTERDDSLEVKRKILTRMPE